jgi:thiamine-monophosphate kinase
VTDNISTRHTDVNTLGEFGLIDHLTKDFVAQRDSTLKAVGDDAAVIDAGAKVMVVSTDMLVEGIHFDIMYTPLKHLGYKSIIVNISDIIAMNAVPEQVTVSIAISSKYSVEALEEFYEGIRLACEIYKVDLIGGDTTSSPRGMTISVTALGSANKEDIVYRNGARPGDIICVTGNLGAAYLGLQVLEREKALFMEHPDIKPDLDNNQYQLERFLKPEARKDAVNYFKNQGLKPTAMIDISDGLASEIMHICKQSKTGALIEEAKVPIHSTTEQLAVKFRLDPITCALSGGEDYELLFTVDPADLEKVQMMPDVYIIGEIKSPAEGIKLLTTGGNMHTIKAQGWVHF